MAFLVTEEDKLKNIADNIIGREMEIASYDQNITNYTQLLQTLPQGDWPTDLEQYKSTFDLDLIPDDIEDTVVELQFRDRIKSLLKTEKRERLKSYQLYQVLISQLPADRKDQLIADAIARLAAAQTQAQ